MPRNGAGIFSLDARYLVSEGDTILPSQHNPVLEDLQTDANTPRPIVAGGTGASTATTARTNLSVYSIADVDDGFTPKVATRTALKALDTATTKAVVLTEASRQKLFMWMTGDFTDSVAGDPSELAYIPADGIDPALGCWVAVTGAGASIVPVIQGGTGANDAATALDNLGGMAKATYDPNAVSSDAFDMANMVEATDAKIMTAAERTAIAGALQASGNLSGLADKSAARDNLGLEKQFYDSDYIDAAQIVHIRNQDIDSQDASVVTAGLQAMHQAMMDFVNAAPASYRIVKGTYRGFYALNDEMFSEAFAQDLWDCTASNARFIFDMLGAEFHAKGWPSHKAVRTSGWYAARTITDPVPMAMWRWEQKTKIGLGPHVYGGTLMGEKAVTDPIGYKARNVNTGYQENFEIANFLNVGRWIDDINNSDFHSPVISGSGFQPTEAGGNGFVTSTLRVSTAAGAGTTTVTANEDVFLADHVGKWFMIEGAGEAGNVFCAKVQSVTDATTAVLDAQCTTDVADKHASFTMINGSIDADSDQLTLSMPVSIDLVGRYVMVLKAGSKIHTDEDVLVTRVTAQAADNKTLTLATQARETVASMPVAVAPCRFTGKCDDQVTEAGVAELGHNNDCQFFGERVEFSYDQVWGSAITSVEQYLLASQGFGGKRHGTDASFNNFGANGMIAWYDNCKTWTGVAEQHEWGDWHPDYAKIVVTGGRNCLLFPMMTIGGITTQDHLGVFYLDPQVASPDNCRVGFCGFFNAATFGQANQKFARYGAHGTPDQLVALGPWITRNKAGYPDMPNFVGQRIELWGQTPGLFMRDTDTPNTRARITMNGGGLSFASDVDDDGTYEDERLFLGATEASFKHDVRTQSGVLRTSKTATLATDTVVALTPPATDGILKFWSTSAGTDGMLRFNADASAAYTAWGLGSGCAVVLNTALAGTTGAAGQFTVAINDGQIQFENRRGFPVTVWWSYEVG